MKLSITGMGIVSPAGIGIENFYESLTKGNTGVGHYEKNPFTRKAGAVKDFSVRQYTKNFKQARPLAKVAHLAIAASKMAAEDGCFSSCESDPYKTGIITGTNEQFDDSNTQPIIQGYEQLLGESGNIESEKLASKGLRELPAKYILQVIPNIATFTCSYELSLNGYSSTIISGSNASFETFIMADIALKRKMADSFFCGATDSLLNPIDVISLIPPGATTVEECTSIPGEGSVFFLIDDASVVDKKKNKVYANITSCTSSLFLHNEDIRRTIEDALLSANLTSNDIDAIVASEGSRSVFSRPVLKAISKVFTTRAEAVPLCSPLPYVGYTRAVAGAFDLTFGVFILETGKIPPMLQPIDTSFCKSLYCAKDVCIDKKCDTVLIINIGLTGCINCVILQEPDR